MPIDRFQQFVQTNEQKFMNENEKHSSGSNFLPLGMSIGIALGTAFGLLTDQLAMGMCFGIAIGSGIGVALSGINKKCDDEEKAS